MQFKKIISTFIILFFFQGVIVQDGLCPIPNYDNYLSFNTLSPSLKINSHDFLLGFENHLAAFQPGKADLFDQLTKSVEIDELTNAAENLNLDTRLVKFGLLHPVYVGLLMQIKKSHNPNNEKFTAFNLAGGPSIASFLLATNATNSYFFDHAPFSVDEFNKRINTIWDDIEQEVWEDDALHENASYYLNHQFWNGYNDCFYWDHIDFMEYKIILELKALGVERNSIRADKDKNGNAVIRFYWNYYGEKVREYKVTFVKMNLLSNDLSLDRIQQSINIDGELSKVKIIFQRAALSLLAKGEKYLPYFMAQLEENGYLILDDWAITEEGYRKQNPDTLFEKYNLDFSKIASRRVSLYLDLIRQMIRNDFIRQKKKNFKLTGYGTLTVRQLKSRNFSENNNQQSEENNLSDVLQPNISSRLKKTWHEISVFFSIKKLKQPNYTQTVFSSI
ncbi:MAG: hypothetical protein KAS13_08740 [Candidatus Omnitrophica bacterium]|nr:hypothetical protein [Candidatus Omnitrophota bacterium]